MNSIFLGLSVFTAALTFSQVGQAVIAKIVFKPTMTCSLVTSSNRAFNLVLEEAKLNTNKKVKLNGYYKDKLLDGELDGVKAVSNIAGAIVNIKGDALKMTYNTTKEVNDKGQISAQVSFKIGAMKKMSKLESFNCTRILDLTSLDVSIAEEIQAIQKSSDGVNARIIKGENIIELLKNIAGIDHNSDKEFEIDSENLELAESISYKSFLPNYVQTWTSVLDLGGVDLGDEALVAEFKKRDAILAKAIKSLSNKGYIIAENPNGHSYCGNTFSSLLVIDLKKGIVIEIALGKGGAC